MSSTTPERNGMPWSLAEGEGVHNDQYPTEKDMVVPETTTPRMAAGRRGG
ncbi:hypothetical protein RSO41_05600 [Halomonas sp. I1]|nr:hypothetical protein [Halomonas sp. I1]MDT8894124.1 hypothetical protein [Halomonas sp. I1]